MAVPDQPGLYWAKRLFIERDNGLEVAPSDEWEIVCVYENSLDSDDRFHVLLIGAVEARLIEHFEWGRGPLTRCAPIDHLISERNSLGVVLVEPGLRDFGALLPAPDFLRGTQERFLLPVLCPQVMPHHSSVAGPGALQPIKGLLFEESHEPALSDLFRYRVGL